MEVLRFTGFKTPSEYFNECNYYDKMFINKALEKYKEMNKKGLK